MTCTQNLNENYELNNTNVDKTNDILNGNKYAYEQMNFIYHYKSIKTDIVFEPQYDGNITKVICLRGYDKNDIEYHVYVSDMPNKPHKWVKSTVETGNYNPKFKNNVSTKSEFIRVE